MMVFYHSILKCHVLIDLKIGKLTHGDCLQVGVHNTVWKSAAPVDGSTMQKRLPHSYTIAVPVHLGIQRGQFRYGAGLLADWAHHRRT